jgi:hypothetical protein
VGDKDTRQGGVERGDGTITCGSYTHARRFPKVIGKLSGWTPWWGPWTITQYGVLVGGFLVLKITGPLWARFSGPVNAVLLIGVPFGLAWYARSAKVEGRSPLRAAIGLAALLVVPPTGRRQGRPVRQPGLARRLRGGWVFVRELPATPLGQPPLPVRTRRASKRRGG